LVEFWRLWFQRHSPSLRCSRNFSCRTPSEFGHPKLSEAPKAFNAVDVISAAGIELVEVMVDAVVVRSKNSCGLPMIEFQQAAEPLSGLAIAG